MAIKAIIGWQAEFLERFLNFFYQNQRRSYSTHVSDSLPSSLTTLLIIEWLVPSWFQILGPNQMLMHMMDNIQNSEYMQNINLQSMQNMQNLQTMQNIQSQTCKPNQTCQTYPKLKIWRISKICRICRLSKICRICRLCKIYKAKPNQTCKTKPVKPTQN